MGEIKARQIKTGTTESDLVELGSGGTLPAVDGSAVTDVDALTLGTESPSDFHDATQIVGTVANATNATNASDSTEWNGSVKTVSTGAPSGGSDGDIHFQYE